MFYKVSQSIEIVAEVIGFSLRNFNAKWLVEIFFQILMHH